MKIVTVVLSLIVVAYVGLLYLTRDFDIVENVYLTKRDAREAGVFERGWLPEIIPDSSTNIETHNDLDLNTSVGRFSYGSTGYIKFRGDLTIIDPQSIEYRRWSDEIHRFGAQGWDIGALSYLGSTWIFFCNSDERYCEYRLVTDAS